MPKALKYGLFLGVLGIIVGALLGLVNFITKPIIEKAELEKVVSTLNAVNSNYTWEESSIDGVYRVGKDNNGNIQMYVYKTSTRGYKSGNLEIMTFIQNDKISKVVLLSMSDQTKGIGTQISNDTYLEGFVGKDVSDYYNTLSSTYNSKNNQVEIISGATYSSRGVVDALIIASNNYVNNVKGGNN